MKHIFMLLIVLISSSHYIHCGISWSRLMPTTEDKKTDPRVEIAIQELNSYLGKIVYPSISKRAELEKHIQSLINRDVRDPKIFPKLNAIMADESNQNNEALNSALNKAIGLNLRSYIDDKCL